MKRKSACTLVELLVVIGIIAMLISILLPALSKARKAVKSAACLSNLHQLVLAFNMYSVNYKGSTLDEGHFNGAPATVDVLTSSGLPWLGKLAP